MPDPNRKRKRGGSSVGPVKKMETFESVVLALKKELGPASWDNLFCPKAGPRDLQAFWQEVTEKGEELKTRYSWAVPSERALNICSQFGPLIEIGAGKGYWAYELRSRGIDIVCADKYTAGDDENWVDDVISAGPELLGDATPAANGKTKTKGKTKGKTKTKGKGADLGGLANGRNLFLCYPDEMEVVSTECFERFTGQYIVHVGELFITGTKAGGGTAPWGRTTDSEFQVLLSEQFHCVIVAKLPGFPHTNDHISVWKRSSFVTLDDDEDNDFVDEEDEPLSYRSVPKEEALPDCSRAAPAFEHLLR